MKTGTGTHKQRLAQVCTNVGGSGHKQGQAQINADADMHTRAGVNKDTCRQNCHFQGQHLIFTGKQLKHSANEHMRGRTTGQHMWTLQLHSSGGEGFK
jgi:hypothetical protein